MVHTLCLYSPAKTKFLSIVSLKYNLGIWESTTDNSLFYRDVLSLFCLNVEVVNFLAEPYHIDLIFLKISCMTTATILNFMQHKEMAVVIFIV